MMEGDLARRGDFFAVDLEEVARVLRREDLALELVFVDLGLFTTIMLILYTMCGSFGEKNKL